VSKEATVLMALVAKVVPAAAAAAVKHVHSVMMALGTAAAAVAVAVKVAPMVPAVLGAAVLLVFGWRAIKAGKREVHQKFMVGALGDRE